jgi:hypothetical protein
MQEIIDSLFKTVYMLKVYDDFCAVCLPIWQQDPVGRPANPQAKYHKMGLER